jgi:hypothetical protein
MHSDCQWNGIRLGYLGASRKLHIHSLSKRSLTFQRVAHRTVALGGWFDLTQVYLAFAATIIAALVSTVRSTPDIPEPGGSATSDGLMTTVRILAAKP